MSIEARHVCKVRLERQPEGKHNRVIVGVKLGDGHLKSHAQGQPEAVAKRHAAHHDARRHEKLLLAAVDAPIPGSEVELELGP